MVWVAALVWEAARKRVLGAHRHRGDQGRKQHQQRRDLRTCSAGHSRGTRQKRYAGHGEDGVERAGGHGEEVLDLCYPRGWGRRRRHRGRAARAAARRRGDRQLRDRNDGLSVVVPVASRARRDDAGGWPGSAPGLRFDLPGRRGLPGRPGPCLTLGPPPNRVQTASPRPSNATPAEPPLGPCAASSTPISASRSTRRRASAMVRSTAVGWPRRVMRPALRGTVGMKHGWR